MFDVDPSTVLSQRVFNVQKDKLVVAVRKEQVVGTHDLMLQPESVDTVDINVFRDAPTYDV
jgi:hypothetical protein